MPSPPPLTAEQRKEALKKAADVRRRRAEFKDSLKAGSLSIRDVFRLAETDEMIGKTKVVVVLESLPGVGKVKARRIMEEIGIASGRRVRGLGDLQRDALLQQYGG